MTTRFALLVWQIISIVWYCYFARNYRPSIVFLRWRAIVPLAFTLVLDLDLETLRAQRLGCALTNSLLPQLMSIKSLPA